MKTSADDWPKALLNGVMLGAILFLSVLPALGWAWHRVLPEHEHVLLSAAQSHDDELAPPERLLEVEPSFCAPCARTQISSGVVHLPSNSGLQVLGIAAVDTVPFVLELPGFSDRIILPNNLYTSPVLLPSDPPPNSRTNSWS